MLQSMGSQRVGHNRVAKLNQHPGGISASSVAHRSPSPHNFLAILTCHKIHSLTWGGDYNLGFHKSHVIRAIERKNSPSYPPLTQTMKSQRKMIIFFRRCLKPDTWVQAQRESLSRLLLHFTVSWQDHLQSRTLGTVHSTLASAPAFPSSSSMEVHLHTLPPVMPSACQLLSSLPPHCLQISLWTTATCSHVVSHLHFCFQLFS